MNSLPVSSTYFSMQSDRSIISFSSGHTAIISFLIPSVIKSTIESMDFLFLLSLEMAPAISRTITLNLLIYSSYLVLELTTNSANKLRESHEQS